MTLPHTKTLDQRLAERQALRQFASEKSADGELIGRDPRTMSIADLQALGHEDMSSLEVIRARCLDCSGNVEAEVRKCVACFCPSWPYRMGTDPFRKRRSMSDEQRQAAIERLARARRSRLAAIGENPSEEG